MYLKYFGAGKPKQSAANASQLLKCRGERIYFASQFSHISFQAFDFFHVCTIWREAAHGVFDLMRICRATVAFERRGRHDRSIVDESSDPGGGSFTRRRDEPGSWPGSHFNFRRASQQILSAWAGEELRHKIELFSRSNSVHSTAPLGNFATKEI